jgi:hypothetical protein
VFKDPKIIAGLGLLLFLLLRAPVPAKQTVQPADQLPRILEKTRAYCDRLERMSLYFVCREQIDERQFDPPIKLFSLGGSGRTTRVALEYDYQLVRKGDSIEEKRVLLKENGRPRHEPDAPLKTKLYKHRYLVFGPLGLLSEYWQSRHVYRYLGEDQVDKEKAFVIEAQPSGSPEPNLLYGKVWVREKDFAIVKIEWDQRSISDLEAVRRMARSIGHDATPRISIVGVYGVEKNGIRFLSELTVHEDYDSRMGIHRASQTEIRYGDYKFFVVETEVRY